MEFSDFECPFCRRVEPTLQQVRELYGDKIRLVWKNFPLPFHKHARPAANIALEVRARKGETAFWDVHDQLLQANPLDDDSLMAMGQKRASRANKFPTRWVRRPIKT